jgi:type IV secretion system protein VirB10
MTKSSGTILDGESRPEGRGAGTVPRSDELDQSAASTQTVQGERSTPVVNAIRSIQSRISSFLAAGLMIALGVGGLSWYYANALNRQSRAREAAANVAVNKAQGEAALPPLGSVEAPHVPALAVGQGADPESAAHSQYPPQALPPAVAAVLQPAPYVGTDPYSTPQHQVPTDRRLSGTAFARESTRSIAAAAPGASDVQAPDAAALMAVSRGVANPTPGNRSEDSLMTLLRPAITTPTRAQTLATQQFLLPKGAFIDCTLETAIDSTLPGMTTCVTATDTFGVDGKVVLLERGSKLIGETRGEVQNGAARVFVLWTEARTPTGVLVPLDSPGTDELGRSGLPGKVNRHFWDRFGAALLISVIDGAMQAAVQSSSRGSGAIIYNPSTSQDALTEVLKGTINIPPAVTKHQGDRIQILVARDLDFRSVYELRTSF